MDTMIGRVLPGKSQAQRKIANAATGHCTAYAVLGEGAGIRIGAESHTELCHLLISNANPDVVHLQEQVLFRYGRNNEHRHLFDFVATSRSGTRTAFTVKPEVRLPSGTFLAKMQVISGFVRKKGFAADTCLLTEADIDPVDLHNARIITAVREPDPEAESVARRICAGFVGAVSIRNLTLRTELAERGYRALLRLIRAGDLRLARRERITPQTLVYRKELLQ